jgi:eukaryotic-like serine/threonine-protein kinase
VQRVGAYEVLYELRSGGMGSVLLGRRRGPGSFEKLVAIKTIRAELAAAQQVRAMFLDEAAILARLGHPAVAAVHDFGEEGGNLYLVMEYVAGVSLLRASELAPPPHIVAAIVAEACRGLHAAHELRDLHGGLLGVVHRDVSPDNVLLGFDGHVKVIDFGIALIKNRQAPVTELGTLKGKPPYMSPEQLKNEPIDRRSDVFALGAVLWEMLVGEPLFTGDSIYAIALAVEQQEIERPSKLVAGLPPGLDSIALEALHRDVAQRTPTAAAMAARLDEVVAAHGGETLAEWTQRTLAAEREAHRKWLAEILGGGSSARPAMGRATGAVTALAAVAPAPAPGAVPVVVPGAMAAGTAATAVAMPAPTAAVSGEGREGERLAGGTAAGVARQDDEGADRDGSAGGAGEVADPGGLIDLRAMGRAERLEAERLETSAEEDARARSRRRFNLFFPLSLALVVGGAFLLVKLFLPDASDLVGAGPGSASRGEDGAPLAERPLVDAGGAPIPTLVEARDDVDAGAVVEAGAVAVIDAGAAAAPSPTGRPDERTRRDPRPRPAVRDAGVAAGSATPPRTVPDEPPPEETAPSDQPPGKLRVTAEPYANVLVDGKLVGATPLFGHKLPAGKHVVVLIDPASGEVRLKKTVVIPSGNELRVEAPPLAP